MTEALKELREKVAAWIAVAYTLCAVLTFGVAAATQKEDCELRARDPVKCRVVVAFPAAIFWPFAWSYALFDALIAQESGK